MSISTSPPELRPTSLGAYRLRQPPRRGIRVGRRGVIAAILALLILLAGSAALFAYENTLPTTVTANVRNGQKDVPTDGSFLISFSRSVSLEVLKAAFSITPATDGQLTSISGGNDFAWTPAKPLAELTAYTVELQPILDVGHHRIGGTHWTFTTVIVPRVVAVTAADGSALADGMEIDP
ncbi:MAG TPA: Ig-like domain-containing protein, partial [Candidatus Dormibacteraeota bacterium]